MKNVLMQEAGDGDGGTGAGGGSGDGTGGSGDSGAGDKQISGENWREFISEDLRVNESLAKFTTLDGLAKSYLNAESMIGKDKIVVPSTDEEWETVYNTLGRPEKPEGYVVENAPDGFKEAVHKIGLTANQAQAVAKWHGELASTAKAKEDSDTEDLKNKVNLELKNDWGEKYAGNVVVAKRVITENSDDGFMDFLETSGLGNDPRMIKFLHKVGSLSGEDNLENGDGEATQTPEQLKEEINGVMATPAYQNKDDPNHDITVQKVSRLFGRLHAAA